MAKFNHTFHAHWIAMVFQAKDCHEFLKYSSIVKHHHNEVAFSLH
ncbi:MAG: hypothetical protein WCG25_05505 [bacterium]